MRVCDRHIDRVARHRVQIVEDDSGFDLCDECKTELLQFLCAPLLTVNGAEPKRRGRPPKNLAQAE